MFHGLIEIPEIEELPGTLSVLNVGAGDLKFSFDKSNPLEVERAKKTVLDMLKRGYTLLVETEHGLAKVQGFDPERCEYIIFEPGEEKPETELAVIDPPNVPAVPDSKPKGKRGRKKGIPADTTKAHAVAPARGG